MILDLSFNKMEMMRAKNLAKAFLEDTASYSMTREARHTFASLWSDMELIVRDDTLSDRDAAAHMYNKAFQIKDTCHLELNTKFLGKSAIYDGYIRIFQDARLCLMAITGTGKYHL